MKLLIYAILAVSTIGFILYKDIKNYARETVVLPPDPVKVVFHTSWNDYTWYENPTHWDSKTHTK